MKKKFLDSLPSNWIKYLLVIIVSMVLWIWAFGLYHAPQKTEKLEVFFGGTVKSYAFEDVAADAIEGVKLVSVSSEKPWSELIFKQKYTNVTLTASDVVIVPEEVAKETQCEYAFNEISEIEGEPFVQEGIQYGVYLPKEKMEVLSEYFEFEYEAYVVFAVASSVNSGQLTNHSFELIKWLVG